MPSPRLSRRLLAVGALTAAAAVGITVVQGIGPGDPAAPGGSGGRIVLGPVANAEDLAANAARKAAAEPDGRPRPGQWSYVKTVLASSSQGVGGALNGPPDRRVTTERWDSVDGSRTASLVGGRLEVRDLDAMERAASPRHDYPYLMSLPTDADALLAEVYRQVDQEGGDATGRHDRAFQIIEVWMRDAALPPRLRAAMYGALAEIPGVRYEAKAADIAGRRGVTLYRIVEGYLRSEIMVDPDTYAYLGFRFIAVRDHVSRGLDAERRSRKGQILGWGGLLGAAIVDKPGLRP
jgi:hypothetical protein